MSISVSTLMIEFKKEGEENHDYKEIQDIEKLLKKLYKIIPATRKFKQEKFDLSTPSQVALNDLIYSGNIKEGLLRAFLSPDLEVRKKYKILHDILQGEPFNRNPFTPFIDGNQVGLQEVKDGKTTQIVDNLGLGIEQLYFILTAIALGNVSIPALEEPEAHLHEQTTGMHLRHLLKKLVLEQKMVDQLFIATHSGLFDLDPDGYWDVSMDAEGATQIRRCTDLIGIDQKHTWQPGPALHALQDLLKFLPPDKVIAQDADGTPITMKEMRQMLIDDDPRALSFVRDVNTIAVRDRVRAFGKP